MKRSWLNKSMLFILLLSGGLQLAAQAPWPLFWVYEVHGNARLQQKNARKTIPLKKGLFIQQGDIVTLQDVTARVILFDHDSNYITLDKKNMYTSDALLQLSKTPVKEPIVKRYFAFVWDEFFKPVNAAPAADNGQIASSRGGVYRGDGFFISPGDPYRSSMDSCMFRWHSVSSVDRYQFSIKGMDGKLYYQQTTRDTQLLVNFRDSLVYGESYTWNVGFNNMPPVDGGLLILVDESRIIPGYKQGPLVICQGWRLIYRWQIYMKKFLYK